MPTSVEARVYALEQRNKRVEEDKEWETSLTRRGAIVIITYFCAALLLSVIDDELVWEHALVPVAGYILSTLTLPALRKMWTNKH